MRLSGIRINTWQRRQGEVVTDAIKEVAGIRPISKNIVKSSHNISVYIPAKRGPSLAREHLIYSGELLLMQVAYLVSKDPGTKASPTRFTATDTHLRLN